MHVVQKRQTAAAMKAAKMFRRNHLFSINYILYACFPIGKRRANRYTLYMQSRFSRRIAAWAVFIIGAFLMISGVGLLFRHVAGVPVISIFLAFLFLIIGSIFAFFAIRLSKRVTYVFFASFLLMVGFYVFFAALGIIPRHVVFRSWPLISVFSGLALIPAGWRHYGTFSSRFIVPSCAFVVLGSILLIFSFDIVTFSFKQFILNWWPLLIVLIGIMMVLVSLGSRHSPGDRDQ